MRREIKIPVEERKKNRKRGEGRQPEEYKEE